MIPVLIAAGYVVSCVALFSGYVALIAYWRWLGHAGLRAEEKARARVSFVDQFIPEVSDVAAQERALDEAACMAALDQVDAARLDLNARVRKALRA